MTLRDAWVWLLEWAATPTAPIDVPRSRSVFPHRGQIPQPPIATRLALPSVPIPLSEQVIEAYCDWRNPALRALLRPGTLLEAYDCGYFRVSEIHRDGILLRSGLGPWRLMTWTEMTKWELAIYSQPANDEDWIHTATPPLLREFGGRLVPPTPAILDRIDQLTRAQRSRRDASIELADLLVAVVAMLRGQAPNGPKTSLRLHAWWTQSPDWVALPDAEILVSGAESIPPSVSLTARLALLATVLRDEQGISPLELELQMWPDQYEPAFEMRFTYSYPRLPRRDIERVPGVGRK